MGLHLENCFFLKLSLTVFTSSHSLWTLLFSSSSVGKKSFKVTNFKFISRVLNKNLILKFWDEVNILSLTLKITSSFVLILGIVKGTVKSPNHINLHIKVNIFAFSSLEFCLQNFLYSLGIIS